MFTVLVICMTGAYVYLTFKQTIIIQPRTSYLCPSWEGRLGNQMFQYASLYGIAYTNNKTLVIGEGDEISDVFPHLTVTRLKDMSVCEVAFPWIEIEPCLYDKDATKLPPGINIIHESFLQSWKYFKDFEFEIREQFVFSDDTEQKCKKAVNDAVRNWAGSRSELTTLFVIGVHIRREDLLKQGKVDYGYQTATPEYFNKSMGYFRKKYSNVVFLVYTTRTPDDLQWREEHVVGNDVILMNMSAPEVDLCSLSKCNHTIMTVGSFGWWAAWLANGTTIYYKDVARNGSELRGDFSDDMSDYYYPGWIAM